MTPSLSVVLLVDTQRARAEWALAAILAQELDGALEVLLFDFANGERPALAGSDHSAVRLFSSERGIGYGDVLAAAVQAASAPLIAFVEEHVIVRPGWARALVNAHQGPYAAICGEVHPGDLSSPCSRRLELVSRNAWSPPAQPGEANVLRWQNVSYKRDVLLGYGERLPRLLDAEDALFRALRRDGHRLAIEPAAKMVHAVEESWHRFLVGSFHSNRLAAASAVELDSATLRARLRRVAESLMGPVRWTWILLRRTRALPDREAWTRVFAANLFYVLEYYAVLAVAGAIGALFGRGDSGARFLAYELGEPRRKPEGVETVTG